MLQHRHIHMFGTVWFRNPPVNEQTGNDYLIGLVKAINMNVLAGPYSVTCTSEGNEGVTGAIVLEFSHASFHSWHMLPKPFLTFDVYSCANFEEILVINHIDKFFGINDISYSLFDRTDGKNELLEFYTSIEE